MNTNWQICSAEQAKELKYLGIDAPAKTLSQDGQTNIYNLSEIAVMLGYSFVSSNVKEAADKLIEELKNGCSDVKDCNARLKEVQSAV